MIQLMWFSEEDAINAFEDSQVVGGEENGSWVGIPNLRGAYQEQGTKTLYVSLVYLGRNLALYNDLVIHGKEVSGEPS